MARSPCWSVLKRREIARQKALKKTRAKRTSMNGKVRRHENGLLDVARKGKYLKLIRQNSESPLLRLPAEIRNMIFTYAVGGNTFEIESHDTFSHTGPLTYVRNRRKDCFSLLLVCRQIYSETALLPFQTSTFSMEIPPYYRSDINEFFQYRLPVERNAVTKVEYLQ